MFTEFNTDPQPKTQLSGTTDLAALKELIDESPIGFSWRYVSGPGAKAWTNSVINNASILLVFKPSSTNVLCELKSFDYREPVGILRKRSSEWDEAFQFRNNTTINGGVTNVW